jgi:hypothetical protein
MPKDIKLYSLFVASPSDVKDELSILSELVTEWNVHHGANKGVYVELVRWETHAFPAVGDRPQAIINRQVLDDSDLVVGIFWSHFGSPTGVAESGTEEEIERSISQGKKVMVYFSDRPLSPSTLNNAEYTKVQSFKDKFRNRGLYWSYSDIDTFRNLLRRHVTATLNSLIEEQSEQNETLRNIGDDPISITLPSNYWIVVLGALDGLQQKFVAPRLAEMRRRGIDHTQLPREETIALAGPIRALGMIVTQLAEKGVMTEEAKQRVGIDALDEKARAMMETIGKDTDTNDKPLPQ